MPESTPQPDRSRLDPTATVVPALVAFAFGFLGLVAVLVVWLVDEEHDPALLKGGIITFLAGMTVGFVWLLLGRLRDRDLPRIESHWGGFGGGLGGWQLSESMAYLIVAVALAVMLVATAAPQPGEQAQSGAGKPSPAPTGNPPPTITRRTSAADGDTTPTPTATPPPTPTPTPPPPTCPSPTSCPTPSVTPGPTEPTHAPPCPALTGAPAASPSKAPRCSASRHSLIGAEPGATASPSS